MTGPTQPADRAGTLPSSKETRINTRTARPRGPRSPRRSRVGAVTLILTATCTLTACSSGAASPEASKGQASTALSSGGAPGTSPSAGTSTPPVLTKLSAMQLAGQRVIYSYTGLTPPAALVALIRKGEVGGVIFFGQNIKDAAQLAAVARALQADQAHSPVHVPLLLMTDQEGGEIRRISGGQPSQSEREIGQSADPAGVAAAAGRGAAGTLKSAGLNMNLAPVLDVFAVPGDFIDQDGRSYSSDPAVVSAAGAAFITAQQGAGVAATAKHFPGLGAAPPNADTDFQPVTLDVPLDRLRSVDEMPYKAAIAAGVDVIMLSWAVYPKLDSRPAGMSPIVVQQELRGRLGFHGVTVTDALEAGALKDYGSPGDRAVSAAMAGMDLIMCSVQNESQGEQATAALAAALKGGRLSTSGFKAAVSRIFALRDKLG